MVTEDEKEEALNELSEYALWYNQAIKVGNPKKDIDTFIKEHTYINYCETVIDKDGMIEYVKPNHLNTMIRHTGKSADEIYDIMPTDAMALFWLIEYTGDICTWSDGFILPKGSNPTEKQMETLKKLIEHKLVKGKII